MPRRPRSRRPSQRCVGHDSSAAIGLAYPSTQTEDVPNMNLLSTLSADAITPLRAAPPLYERSVHQWSQAEIDALTLAYAARRPLLVRGEPGTGKTQIARAAAVHCAWKLHSVTIHPRFDPQHLIARFDAIRRLADAQSGQLRPDTHYWTPGPLWRAYGWDSAQPYLGKAAEAEPEPAPTGHVILIDEIDKADSDLPNSLLELLGQRSFEFAPLGLNLGGPDAALPLVIVTTNEERELPAAFVRRCLVLNLAAPADYQSWLVQRGRAHYQSADRTMDERVLIRAAEQLVADRAAMTEASLAPPGAAEYLDLLSAVYELAPKDADLQLAWLDRLSAYAYVKHSNEASPLKQSRPPVGTGED